MNEAQFNELREAGWRRPLTAEEEARCLAYLADHPQGRVSWDEDLALNEHLRHLPEAPLSSNFTSQVLAGVRAEIAREALRTRPILGRWSWPQWLPRFALPALLLLLTLGGFYQYQASSRAEAVRNLGRLSEMMVMTGPQALQDFDAIRSLPPETDDDLLAALQ